MISIEKLIQNLMQCRDSNLVLPKLNDSDDNPYVQKTAIDLRRMELEKVEEVFSQLNESNFTMDNVLEELNRKIAGTGTGTGTGIIAAHIAPDALIIYVENETAPLPEVIINLLRVGGNSQDEWYIYGVKNPESFYKSFLLLTQLDFIIKNKTEKKNEVATFKREMALHYETFYKTLEYRNLRLPHHDMIHKLTSIDNYCGYDAVRFLCDYCQVNIILLDIIEKKYIDIRYTPNTLVPNVVKKPHTSSEFIIIIKYAAETYLPLMNSNGTHIFAPTALDWIAHNYERLVVDKFKEPKKPTDTKEPADLITSEQDYETTALGDVNELNLSDIEEPEEPSLALEPEDTGNFLDSTTVSLFFNNSIPQQEKQVNMNPIIKAGAFTMAIEDMIEISDEYSAPVKKQNAFEMLLDKIPTSSNSSKSAKNNSTTRTSPRAVIQPKEFAPTPTPTPTPALIPADEELQPIKTYNLLDLQMLSRLHKIDTQKEGKAGKKVNKTKEEMYSEIKEKLDKK